MPIEIFNILTILVDTDSWRYQLLPISIVPITGLSVEEKLPSLFPPPPLYWQSLRAAYVAGF